MTADACHGSALQVYAEYNGKPYSSMDTERCIVVFVASVSFLDQASELSAAGRGGEAMAAAGGIEAAREAWANSVGDSFKGTSFGKDGQTELPSCPVCLERLDMSVTGIMTTICNHSFHCRCLSEWPDTSCPVCRYCQQPESDLECLKCGATNDLWMCVICGFVGCGRYIGEHALEHYKESGHNFSIELNSQRVWDYSGDNYVHRLVASKLDGKLVELPDSGSHSAHKGKRCSECGGGASSSVGADKELHDTMLESKMESVLMEYNEMLTRTLEQQRHFFEGKIYVLQEMHDKERSELNER